MAFLSRDLIENLGFREVGENVSISDKAVFYGAERISIGDHTRIDDFCILSAGANGITIGRHIHIACYSSLIGRGKISIEDFANISSRVAIYSSSDDYSGDYLTNPTIPEEYTNVTHGDVTIEKHVIIGCGTVVLPNVVVGMGTAIGALSLINQSCLPTSVYAGVPAKKVKDRGQGFLAFEKKFNDDQSFR